MTREVAFIAHAVSFSDLVSMWIDTFHEDDYTIVIYDPLNHMSILKKLNLGHDSLKVLYESKILTISFNNMEDAQLTFSSLKSELGPYVQLYFAGKYITDNIDE
jgi:hypothetical protein